MLEWLASNKLALSVALAGVVFLAWPVLVKVPGVVSGVLSWLKPGPSPKPLPASHSVLDDVVCLRKHLAKYPDAVRAIDEVIVPACVKVASEE